MIGAVEGSLVLLRRAWRRAEAIAHVLQFLLCHQAAMRRSSVLYKVRGTVTWARRGGECM
jgi:hypothetical protein